MALFKVIEKTKILRINPLLYCPLLCFVKSIFYFRVGGYCVVICEDYCNVKQWSIITSNAAV